MDLSIIGKFIKETRKAKGLTQLELANNIMVSEKTISKWECGNGFPDTTLILPLCRELGITANELLSGKKLDEQECIAKADENLVDMRKSIEEKDKFLLKLELVIGLLSTINMFAFIFIASFVVTATWLRVLLIVYAFVEFLFGIHFALLIEKDAGLYKCAKCGYKYVPSFKSVYLAMHINRTRYMKCPNCGKKSWHKKIINNN